MATIRSIKNDVVEVCRSLYERRYLVAKDGNVSVRTDDDRIVATPSGKCKGFLMPEDLLVTDMDGNPLQGPGKPSSELKMHIGAYRVRRDIRAAVHTHPPITTAFAVAGAPLTGCTMAEVVLTLGSVAVAEFATPSTEEVPDSIIPYITRSNAVMLANHGLFCVGKNVFDAYYTTEKVEHFAEVSLFVRQLGGAMPISPDKLGRLEEAGKGLGLSIPRIPCNEFGSCATGEPSCPASGPSALAANPNTGDMAQRIARQVLSELGGHIPDEQTLIDLITKRMKESL